MQAHISNITAEISMYKFVKAWITFKNGLLAPGFCGSLLIGIFSFSELEGKL